MQMLTEHVSLSTLGGLGDVLCRARYSTDRQANTRLCCLLVSVVRLTAVCRCGVFHVHNVFVSFIYYFV